MNADDMTLEEVEARMDELDKKKEQADDLAESFNDAADALAAISVHSLTDDEMAAKISMLRHMLRQIRQHDVRVNEGIHHERHALYQRADELRHEEETEAYGD
jgi:chromosome segregation ATPase